jgi:hypothetical protein
VKDTQGFFHFNVSIQRRAFLVPEHTANTRATRE